MNWYRKAKNEAGNENLGISSWLAKEIARITNNYNNPLIHLGIYNISLDQVVQWIRENKPDLNKISLTDAFERARDEKAEQQDTNPNLPNFIAGRFGVFKGRKAVTQTAKNRINKSIHTLGNFHEQIPLRQIFDICKENDIIPVQEDGKVWGGMLIGGAECGSDEARQQQAEFNVAVKNEDGRYVFVGNNILRLSWCKMGSGKYEIVAYIS